MEAFKKITGTVAPLDRANIDTDAILPKQFLKRIEKRGYGQYLFYDWRYTESGEPNSGFLLNKPEYQIAQVLLTRENFGCGSSREHAPWALEDFGFKAIIAPSFADIFYNNCFKNGILPISLPNEKVQQLFGKAEAKKGYQLTVDLEKQVVRDNEGFETRFEVDEYRRDMLLNGLDEISATIQFEKEIMEFEKEHRIFYSI
ncbi:3-isopropylmalate dehydratase small subunit [Planomicrobium okeanokoites]|uniref:3-isopropylmalate dehydratase small subunit n=1 Tax=Planomicrobium okeanokoites TaxID=244 RepID=A0ABV7KRU8_PLAOK|nr:3-isopropylmalate dehydratase small subunit [Planomicrobium okeanokoites]TAA70041.1 3-isopropylmalate dehydratase small subunit [Planomicrobium okeanokoites]